MLPIKPNTMKKANKREKQGSQYAKINSSPFFNTYAEGGEIPKGFDLENAEEIRGDETLDEWVRDNWGDNYDWSLSKYGDNYELVEDAVATDDEGNVAVFYVFNSDDEDTYAEDGEIKKED